MSVNLKCLNLLNVVKKKTNIESVNRIWKKFSSSGTFFTILIVLAERSFAQGSEIETSTRVFEEADTVSNIQASAFYDEEMNDIHLNVSWKNPSEITLQTWQIKQNPGFKDNEYCNRGEKMQERIVPSESTSVILGKQHFPNCTYKVEIVGKFVKDKEAPHIIYTVPDCVDKKCICNFEDPLPVEPDITVEQISTDVIRINWKIPEISTMTNISTIYFSVYQRGSSKELASVTRTIKTDCAARACYEDVSVSGMTTGTSYTVEALYTNALNCKSETTYILFNAQDVAESQLAYQVMLSLMFVIMFVCLLWFVWKRKCGCLRILHSSSPSHLKRIDIAATDSSGKPTNLSFPMEYNNLYVQKNVDEYEVSYTQLQIGPQIGDGAFGQVFLARLPPHIIVAVKTLKQNAVSEELDDFLLEIAILKQIGRHPNIVTLLGCCTVRQPYCIVMEYIPCGDLLRYLHALRTYYERKTKSFLCSGHSSKQKKETVLDDSLTALPSIPFDRLPSISKTVYTELTSPSALECVLEPRELQSFAVQIARGMRHLERKQIVHRDLAARNVLIDENKILKISDFGLSRRGTYVNSKQKKVPLRWMSVEAIRDNLYTNKSDVWAFGIVLWEIGTLGGFPYPTVSNTDILEFLLSGNRLEKPENCTAELYALMLRSWSSAEERPSFTELLEDLEAISSKRRVYVDFSQLNPAYMFPSKTQLCTNEISSSETETPEIHE